MAVTLYRCSKCRGVFNTVWDVSAGVRYCRDCKLQSRGFYANPQPNVEQVKIIGDEEDSMGGGKAGQAIGQPIGDAEEVFAQQQSVANSLAYQQGQQNWAGQAQNLLGAVGGQQAFSGGSEIRSPFQWTSANIERLESLKPGNTFVSTDGVTRVISIVQRLDDTRVMVTDSVGVCAVINVPPSWTGTDEKKFRSPIQYAPPKPEPESSPHDAILKPSRKLKLAAE